MLQGLPTTCLSVAPWSVGSPPPFFHSWPNRHPCSGYTVAGSRYSEPGVSCTVFYVHSVYSGDVSQGGMAYIVDTVQRSLFCDLMIVCALFLSGLKSVYLSAHISVLPSHPQQLPSDLLRVLSSLHRSSLPIIVPPLPSSFFPLCASERPSSSCSPHELFLLPVSAEPFPPLRAM